MRNVLLTALFAVSLGLIGCNKGTQENAAAKADETKEAVGEALDSAKDKAKDALDAAGQKVDEAKDVVDAAKEKLGSDAAKTAEPTEKPAE